MIIRICKRPNIQTQLILQQETFVLKKGIVTKVGFNKIPHDVKDIQ